MSTPQWTPPKDWRWMANMTAIDRDTGDRGIVVWVGVNGLSVMRPGAMRLSTVSIVDAIPDRDCPATLGCMTAEARRLWLDDRLHVSFVHGWRIQGWQVNPSDVAETPALVAIRRRLYPTEFDALWAAIDGAP